MKILVTHIIFVFTTLVTYAHEYHFAFAEVAYNSSTKTIQATISLSAHDLEHSLGNNEITINHLESYKDNAMMQLSMSDYILKHFQLSIGNEVCNFAMIGYEVLNTGIANFYFESQIVELNTSVDILFDLMMDTNPEQQNKLTFITPEEKQTAEFLYNARKQQITLSKLEQ